MAFVLSCISPIVVTERAEGEPDRASLLRAHKTDLDALHVLLRHEDREVARFGLIARNFPSDVDPRELRILRRLDAGEAYRFGAAGRVKEPKTERSRRRVPLTARAKAALDSLPRRIDTRLVFPAPRGGHIDMHNLARRDWHPALDAASVPSRRLYDLRHTFASNALAAGISLYELSRYMGASVRVLEMHYAHLVRDAEEVARTKLDAAAGVWASSGRRVSGGDTENP